MAIVKECELCGDEFEAKRKYSRFCYKKHMRDCIVCEEEFEVVVPSRPAVTCSQKCAGKYSKNPSVYTNIYKDNREIYIKKCGICHNEFETTNKNKKHCGNKHERNCQICGDKFIMTSQTQIYCTKQHYKDCEVCGEKFKIKQNHRPGKVCSFRCAGVMTKIKMDEKSRSGNMIYKHQKKCLICNDLFNTNRKNQVYCKMPHPMRCVCCKKDFEIERVYPDRKHYSCGDKECIKYLTEYTNTKKYGVSNVFETESVKEKARETNLNNHGVKYSSHIGIKNYEDYLNLKEFLLNTNQSVSEISEYFNISIGALRNFIKKYNLEYKFAGFYTLSQKEQDFLYFIESLDEKADYIINDRRILEGKEVDFYFPNLGLAIEISPTYTHNAKFGWNRKEEGKDENYHWDKFEKCRSREIELITIFDWHQWENVMRYVSKLISGNYTSIFGYKTKIKDKMNHKTSNFINEHKMTENQGLNFDLISEISDNDEIISVVTFQVHNKECIILDFTFNAEYNREILMKLHIESFPEYSKLTMITDNSLGNSLYLRTLGFEIREEISPKLHYYNSLESIHISPRVAENTIIDKHDDRTLPVYDCGHTKWIMIYQNTTY